LLFGNSNKNGSEWLPFSKNRYSLRSTDNATYQLSWSPDALSLVGVYYNKLSSSYILEIRGVNEDKLQRVNLTEALPAVERVRNPVLSPDGRRVAFVTELKEGGIDLLILTLEDLRVINLTDTTLFQEVAVTHVGWLPQ
jgi:Tol biopolymer transport system component